MLNFQGVTTPFVYTLGEAPLPGFCWHKAFIFRRGSQPKPSLLPLLLGKKWLHPEIYTPTKKLTYSMKINGWFRCNFLLQNGKITIGHLNFQGGLTLKINNFQTAFQFQPHRVTVGETLSQGEVASKDFVGPLARSTWRIGTHDGRIRG